MRPGSSTSPLVASSVASSGETSILSQSRSDIGSPSISFGGQ